MRHQMLAELFHAFLDAGLMVERVVEAGDGPVPITLGIRARKP